MDKALDANFNGGTARSQEIGGIIAILEMITDAVKTATDYDNEVEADYGKSRGDFRRLSDIYHDFEKAGDDFECMADKEIELKATIKSLEEEIFTSKTIWRSC